MISKVITLPDSLICPSIYWFIKVDNYNCISTKKKGVCCIGLCILIADHKFKVQLLHIPRLYLSVLYFYKTNSFILPRKLAGEDKINKKQCSIWTHLYKIFQINLKEIVTSSLIFVRIFINYPVKKKSNRKLAGGTRYLYNIL